MRSVFLPAMLERVPAYHGPVQSHTLEEKMDSNRATGPSFCGREATVMMNKPQYPATPTKEPNVRLINGLPETSQRKESRQPGEYY
jgi:hypothetical protein